MCAVVACSTTAAARASLEPDAVAAFADEFFLAALAAERFPGAVFVVVEGGHVVFARGYGVADVAAGAAVDPDRTLFPVASVTKLFTATVAMQQVAAGRIDLDTDIAAIVDVPVSSVHGPVTLAHLLTHTAGFEDSYIGVAALDAASRLPLRTYLERHAPAQVRAPGDIIMYSNYGYALAGYAIEQAAGRPLADLVVDDIFVPLGMTRARLHPDKPSPSGARAAKAYAAGVELPTIHIAVWPAGSLQATAREIGAFMIAHLTGGLLNDTTQAQMHAQHFAHHPRLAGWTLGFAEHTVGPERALQHDGDLPGYNGRLLLLPERELGFYVVNNGSDLSLRVELTEAFFARFVYPEPDTQPLVTGSVATPAAVPQRAHRGARLAGYYRSARYPRTTVDKLAGVALEFRVETHDDGSLTLHAPPIPGLPFEPTRWVPIEPMLFRHAEREEYIAFRTDERGAAVLLFAPLFSNPWAYEAIRWIETQRVQIAVLVIALAAFLSAAFGWPLAHIVRRRRARVGPHAPGANAGAGAVFPAATLARIAAGSASALMLVFITGTALIFEALFSGQRPVAAYVVFALPLVALLPIALALGFAPRMWRQRWWTCGARVHYTVVVLALLVFLPFLSYWNLLSFRF
jgi:CubicO group peptidase (beta-lactamase class C family)